MTMTDILAGADLLRRDQHGVVRIPFLVRGELVAPREISHDDALAALGDRHHAEQGEVQLLRTATSDGTDLFFVLPRIDDPALLTPADPDELAAELYCVSSAEAADYIARVNAALVGTPALLDRMLDLSAQISGAPRTYLQTALSGHGLGDAAYVRRGVDRELAFGGHAGSRCLDDWVEVERTTEHGTTARLSSAIGDAAFDRADERQLTRAFPTRQLHVTAGNSPLVPLISAFRAFAVKGALTLKMPSGAVAGGAALALAMHAVDPAHPLTRFSSIAYWRGGDERIEDVLLGADVFDRIVVWGDATAVASITARASLTKTVTFNPRYGVSFIGAAALAPDYFDETVDRAAAYAMVENQKACIASLVQYVEADHETASRFAEALSAQLQRWDEYYPQCLTADGRAQVRRARRGALRFGEWHANGEPGSPTSAAVVMDGEFDVWAHPMTRVVAVRPVAGVDEVIARLHPGVSQVGVAPERRRLELRDRICARGVTAVPALGEADGHGWCGYAHDGRLALSELVSWVTS